jgi:hypothetical protein
VSNFALTAAHRTELTCPHCDDDMPLVRRIDLKEMPEIYIFYCSRCQHAETVKQELNTLYVGRWPGSPSSKPKSSA